MARRVSVVPHNPEWRRGFDEAAQEILQAWGDEVVQVHHIGSTAIPDLAAKPIIDILVEVHDVTRLDGLNENMACFGYQAMGEFGIPGRRFFIRGGDENRSHHVHAFNAGCPDVVRHLAFRDFLTAHPARARQYGDLKIALARAHPSDIAAYIAGKHSLVASLEEQALAWRQAGGQVIRTLRLHLQALTRAELEQYTREPEELARELGLRITTALRSPDLERALALKLEKMNKAPETEHPWYTYWLMVLDERPFGAGLIGFKGSPDAHGQVEIGYGTDAAVRGRGYTTEAVRALIGWAFCDPRCTTITATHVLKDNISSIRVLQKVGMQVVEEDEHTLSWIIRRKD